MDGIYLEKGKNYNIPDNVEVKVTTYKAQHRADVTATELRRSVIDNFQKVNANEYIDKRSGELKAYNKNTIKPEKTVKRSMRKLEKILTNNFCGEDDERFITLTTEEETKDIDDMKKYMKNFPKALKKIYGAGFKCAYVFEMQTLRESWHIHMVTKGTKGLQNDAVEKYWNKGLTRTTKITDKYTDFEIDEEKAMQDPNGFLGRQTHYGIERVISYMTKYESKESMPSKVRAYSVTRNLEKPVEGKMLYGQFKESCKANNYARQDEYTTLIKSTKTDKIINRVKKEKWTETTE